MKKFTLTGILALSAATFFHSCINEDRSDRCDQTLRIEYRWMNLEPRTDYDSARMTIISPDGGLINLSSDRTGRDVSLEPATYDIIGWEPAENIVMSGRTVSFVTRDGEPLTPQQFGAGTTTAEVYADIENQVIPLPMYRQVRELIVAVNFTGEGVQLMEKVSGIISGLAFSRDIDNAFPPVSGAERPEGLTEGTVSYDFFNLVGTWFQGSRMLIGNYGQGEQRLTLNIDFSSNYSNSISLDVTEEMNGFHTINVDEPWYIQLYLNVGVNFDMTIVDWTAGSESTLEAS